MILQRYSQNQALILYRKTKESAARLQIAESAQTKYSNARCFERVFTKITLSYKVIRYKKRSMTMPINFHLLVKAYKKKMEKKNPSFNTLVRVMAFHFCHKLSVIKKTSLEQGLLSVSGIRYQVSDTCDFSPLKYQVSKSRFKVSVRYRILESIPVEP